MPRFRGFRGAQSNSTTAILDDDTSATTSSTPLDRTSSGRPNVPQPDAAGDTPPPDNYSISNAEYARKCQALMKLYKDLKELGADSMFDLPKIVVIGSQSAGKSSLVEAVTEISVPRDSGTCTRCPVECTMSSAATSWSCTISLRRHHDNGYEGSPPKPERFGPVITDKKDIDLWLRRAQAAILSTDGDKKKWENKSVQEIRTLIQNAETSDMRTFTRDTILVDIEDQGVTDLAFVDLPGIIQNADDQSVELIKNLVRAYVREKNTLILVTTPASEDMQNQGAVTLAKKADPSGDRTIGVITKPDMLGEGEIGLRDFWKEMLENPKTRVGGTANPHYLQHGYYCVRLPNDSQRGQGMTAADVSARFFDNTKPWSEVRDRKRLGVMNLVQDVSALLVKLIEKNLPKLRSAVEEALKICESRLAELPPLLQGEPLTNVMLMINGFLRDLNAASVGDDHKVLSQKCRARYEKLRQAIFTTCPEFKAGYSEPGALSSATKPLNISQVDQLIKDSTAWELPVYTPYDAIKFLIKRFLREWDAPTQACSEDIFRIFSSFIKDLAETHFGNYPRLQQYVLTHARVELENCREEARTSVNKLLEYEQAPYFTQRSDFVKSRSDWVRHYSSKPQFGCQPERPEIQVMATVRAYFQCAYERFADSMLLAEECELVQALRPNLEQALLNNLMLPQGSGSTPEELLAEDESIQRERRELTERRERLIRIRDILDTQWTIDQVQNAPSGEESIPTTPVGSHAESEVEYEEVMERETTSPRISEAWVEEAPVREYVSPRVSEVRMEEAPARESYNTISPVSMARAAPRAQRGPQVMSSGPIYYSG